MSTPDRYLIAGIISTNTNIKEVAEQTRKNIEQIAAHGGHERIKEQTLAALAEIAIKYYQQVGEFLDVDSLQAVLVAKGATAERVTALTWAFAEADKEEVTPQKFRFWLHQAAETDKSIELADVLSAAGSILEGKVSDADGIMHSGFRDAVAHLNENIARIAATTNITTQPRGNAHKEVDEILAEVEKRESGETAGIVFPTGYDFIDNNTGGGLKKSNFMMVGAFAGEGKTKFSVNLAWFWAHVLGVHGALITTEMKREEMRRQVLTRHTHLPGVGTIGGIPYTTIETAQWADEKQRECFARVVQDFGNPHGRYGVLDIMQVSRGATMDDVWQLLNSFEPTHGVKPAYVILDYLAVLGHKDRKLGARERITSNLIAFKEILVTFDNGEGLVGVAPHQMKQEAWEEVKPETGKFYTKADYADTSEAEKSIDIGIALLHKDEQAKLHETAAGILKNRHGAEPPEIFSLYENYAACYLGNLTKSA